MVIRGIRGQAGGRMQEEGGVRKRKRMLMLVKLKAVYYLYSG
jgi:hypothetical protein